MLTVKHLAQFSESICLLNLVSIETNYNFNYFFPEYKNISYSQSLVRLRFLNLKVSKSLCEKKISENK